LQFLGCAQPCSMVDMGVAEMAAAIAVMILFVRRRCLAHRVCVHCPRLGEKSGAAGASAAKFHRTVGLGRSLSHF
jgi:hypothetical protein